MSRGHCFQSNHLVWLSAILCQRPPWGQASDTALVVDVRMRSGRPSLVSRCPSSGCIGRQEKPQRHCELGASSVQHIHVMPRWQQHPVAHKTTGSTSVPRHDAISCRHTTQPSPRHVPVVEVECNRVRIARDVGSMSSSSPDPDRISGNRRNTCFQVLECHYTSVICNI